MSAGIGHNKPPIEPSLNMTPMRIRALKFLAEKPKGYDATTFGHEMLGYKIERDNYKRSYTSQSMARWSGSYTKALVEHGYVEKRNIGGTSFARTTLFITEKGREFLMSENCDGEE